METIENTALPSLSETKHKYQLDFTGEYLLFVYHPVTTEDHDLAILEQMLEVLLGTDMNLVCIMPNSDAGSDKITSVYKKFYHKRHFHAVTNFGPLDYLTMLKHTVMLVGNSSSGIIEAASFRVPVINIGSRQKGRERSDNVIDILENKDELIHAIGHVQGREFQQSLNTLTNVYGRKNTSLNIVRKIKELVKSEQLIQKTITY
ncbi:Polysialic acid biosynthesis protein P7 [compost metagenome]